MQQEKTVIIFTSSDNIEIERVSQHLEENNITCLVQNNPVQSLGLGAYILAPNLMLMDDTKIMILEKDADRALGLIKEIFPDFYKQEEPSINYENTTVQKPEKEIEVPPIYVTLQKIGLFSFILITGFKVLTSFISVQNAGLFISLSSILFCVLNGFIGYKTGKTRHVIFAILLFALSLISLLTIFQ